MPALHSHNHVDGLELGQAFVHEQVAASARRHGDRVALFDAHGRQLTYAALLARIDHLAGRLTALGVQPEDRVVVSMERSLDLVVAMGAVLQAGAVYVPLPPSDPAARTAKLLTRIGAAIAICGPDVRLEECAWPATVLDVNGDEVRRSRPRLQAPDEASARAATRATALNPDHLAYLLFTSGSTGEPKAVGMPHRGLSRLIQWQVASGPPALRTLQFTAMSFDVCFQEILSTLTTGGTLVQVSDGLRRDPEQLLRFLVDHAIERMFLPYVSLQQLAMASNRTGIVPQALRHVITAGERLIITPAIIRLFQRLPECRLDNHYGPTEAHLVSSFTLGSHPGRWPVAPPIGRAVTGVQWAVLDDEMTRVANGEVGTLYVSGPCLARGYFGAPGQTAERFVPDPLGEGRLYNTGDLVRVDEAGELRFIGRADDQLKIRGHRVEPAEVQACLAAHPDIQEVAVGLRPLTDDMDVLVAYIVSERPPGAAELTRHASATLPPYMVPSRFVLVPTLPLSPNGKVDAQRLRDIPLPEPSAAVTPGATLEHEIHAIWRRVLGHDEFGPDDDFFDVGGDSLLATWVVAELAQSRGRPVELSVMLRDSTVRGLTRALAGQAAPARPRSSEIVTLRSGSSRRTLYLMHPLGGELMAYRALAAALRSPVRTLGIRWRPDPQDDNPITLQSLAALHLAQLRAIQPVGPYSLAGWSFGGVLAYEMAQQLRACGQEVDYLGLLDANPLRDPITGLTTARTSHLATLDRLVAALDEAGCTEQGGAGLPALFAASEVQCLLGGVGQDMPAEHLRRHLNVARMSMRAAMTYRPVPYHGTIDLFQAQDTPAHLRAALADDMGTLAAGRLRYHEVPGEHSTLLTPPHVEATARLFDLSLLREAPA